MCGLYTGRTVEATARLILRNYNYLQQSVIWRISFDRPGDCKAAKDEASNDSSARRSFTATWKCQTDIQLDKMRARCPIVFGYAQAAIPNNVLFM